MRMMMHLIYRLRIYLKKLRFIKRIEKFESYDLRNYILYYNARVSIAKVEN